MSVVIKGMQMPEDCFSCPLKEEGFCNITNAYAAQIYKRNSDCPLVELPERLTDDDFETIRIHLSAFKEKLCNQKRWEEAEEYQRIIDRFMAFAQHEFGR